MNKDNILKIKDLQGNEKEVNANDPKYIIAELERKEAELVTAYCNLLYEKMQYRHMQNGVILFLDEINKQSDQEFKEFIEGITEARENYKNDIERYCNK